jgi:hypothetical protein
MRIKYATKCRFGKLARLSRILRTLVRRLSLRRCRSACRQVSDYAPGYDAETYFTKTFKAAGGEIIGSARTPQQETNFSAYMERALQAKPDALYMFQRSARPRSPLSRPMSSAV